nr:MAG TPA_asm: hypothetical protein [Caudoviricetes sp.]
MTAESCARRVPPRATFICGPLVPASTPKETSFRYCFFSRQAVWKRFESMPNVFP